MRDQEKYLRGLVLYADLTEENTHPITRTSADKLTKEETGELLEFFLYPPIDFEKNTLAFESLKTILAAIGDKEPITEDEKRLEASLKAFKEKYF